MLQVVSWNVRSLGDKDWKREATFEIIEGELESRPDIVVLTETKCKTAFKRLGKRIFQTQHSGLGGVLTQYEIANAKSVKALQ